MSNKPTISDVEIGEMIARLIEQNEIAGLDDLYEEMRQSNLGNPPPSLNKQILQHIHGQANPTPILPLKSHYRMLRTVAIILLVVTCLFTVELWAPSPVQAFLRYFSSYFTTESERSENINFQKSETYPAPLNWVNLYAPEYIPNGYTILDSSNTEVWYGIDYEKQPNKYIRFRCYLKNYSGTLDSENYQLIREIKINDITAKLTVSKGITTINWTENDCYFQIYTNERDDIAEQIAKSVKLQNNPERR